MKKKLLIKKTAVVSNSKIVTPKAVLGRVTPKVDAMMKGVDVSFITTDKPGISKLIKIFKQYERKCCAAQLVFLRSNNSKQQALALKQAKQQLFQDLLDFGLARYVNWNEVN